LVSCWYTSFVSAVTKYKFSFIIQAKAEWPNPNRRPRPLVAPKNAPCCPLEFQYFPILSPRSNYFYMFSQISPTIQSHIEFNHKYSFCDCQRSILFPPVRVCDGALAYTIHHGHSSRPGHWH
jgi:hypothetical protein